MSSKRQPSKQRRQTQNQKERAAREARTQAAAATAAVAGTVAATSTSTSGSSSGSGSVLSRFRSPRTTVVPSRTRSSTSPVGQRAALSALLAAVAAAVVGSFLFKVPVDRAGDPITSSTALVAEWSVSAQDALAAAPGATAQEVADAVEDWLPGGSEPYIQAFWPMSLTVVLPVIGTALGYRAVSKRSPAKVVNRTMYVTLFGSLLASQLLIIFLPAVIALGVAAFQVRKYELVTQQAAAANADDAASAGVIDVAEADDADELEPDEL